jgi:hypothetical protein
MKPRPFARARYSNALLSRVALSWRRLSDDERRSVIRAARLAGELTALGAPAPILAMAARLVEDEVRHVEVCGRVLEALEGEAAAGETATRTLAAPRAAAADGVAVARTLIGELALGKPIRAASFAAARAVTREPLMAWAYTELLHDEARHATFGAKAAAWVVRHWSQPQRQTLWVECLAASDLRTAPELRDPEAEALGLLPVEVEPILPRWLLPHLAPLGVTHLPSSTFVH